MSSYQYYEFQAIDKPLSAEELEELGHISSRAQITPFGFSVTYNYSNLRAEPGQLLEKYFDVFLYVDGWGTRRFMMKIPKKIIDKKIVEAFCHSEFVEIEEHKECVIISFSSDSEEHGWEEGEGWLNSLYSLRSDIIHGDYRCLYLGWLYALQEGEFSADQPEPLLPANLKNLNDSLDNFAEFIRLDSDLIEVAAENSQSEILRKSDDETIRRWIDTLSLNEKNEILFNMIKSDSSDQLHLLQLAFRKAIPEKKETDDSLKPRKAGELLDKLNALRKNRAQLLAEEKKREKERLAREAEIKRKKYLADITGREKIIWEKIFTLIETRLPKNYDEAVQLIVDLRDLSNKDNNDVLFKKNMDLIHKKHYRKSSFINRLKPRGLC